MQSTGVTHKSSCPHTKKNGIIERKHRHIVKTSLTFLAQSFLHLKFWDDAFAIVVYLINMLPTLVLHGQSHLEKLLNTKPDYSLKVFSC